MARPSQDQLHALALPTGAGMLLVPSATIAEVVNVPELSALPLAPAWLLGVFGWRSLAVPVLSFEALLGKPARSAVTASKAVVFYPLPGRSQWEYFAVLSSAEPRPQTVDRSAAALAVSELPASPYIAAGLNIGGQPMWIPSFDGFKKAFYQS